MLGRPIVKIGLHGSVSGGSNLKGDLGVMAEIDQKRQADNSTQQDAADAFQRGKESCHHCE